MFAVIALAFGTGTAWSVWLMAAADLNLFALAIASALIALMFAGLAISYDESQPTSVVLGAAAADQFRAEVGCLTTPMPVHYLYGEQAERAWDLAGRLAPTEVG